MPGWGGRILTEVIDALGGVSRSKKQFDNMTREKMKGEYISYEILVPSTAINCEPLYRRLLKYGERRTQAVKEDIPPHSH